jgi:hypothetical protein
VYRETAIYRSVNFVLKLVVRRGAALAGAGIVIAQCWRW